MLKLKSLDRDIWFTSDTHYNHAGICYGVSDWDDKEVSTRDFKSLEEMNQTIVDGINKYVKEDDVLFHLGDWSFGGIESIWNFRKQINCKEIHLIYGNHDHHIVKNKILPNISSNIFPDLIISAQDLFTSTQHYLEIEIDKKLLCLMHYPIEEWNTRPRPSRHLHGHMHDRFIKQIANRINIGLDPAYKRWGEYKPFNYKEL